MCDLSLPDSQHVCLQTCIQTCAAWVHIRIVAIYCRTILCHTVKTIINLSMQFEWATDLRCPMLEQKCNLPEGQSSETQTLPSAAAVGGSQCFPLWFLERHEQLMEPKLALECRNAKIELKTCLQCWGRMVKLEDENCAARMNACVTQMTNRAAESFARRRRVQINQLHSWRNGKVYIIWVSRCAAATQRAIR